jgi:nuclear transport factor 2 (NTF2) superfamily protein
MIQTELVDRTHDETLGAGASVISIQKAKELVALFARVTTTRDAKAFAEGFTQDSITRFNAAELHGRGELQAFMESRFALLSDSFICEKTLRSISGNVLGVTWVNHWDDPKTKQKMIGRGSEFWIMDGDLIARWDAVTAIWPIE